MTIESEPERVIIGNGGSPEPLADAPMSFTGTGADYFRVWIVNLTLTLVTLGVYSAWAKVRRLQYFYRHTRLAGAGFDYHGDPIAILTGRMVGLILFGLYSAAGYLNIWLAATIFVVLATMVPWLLDRSLRFRLHNTSYRAIRFKFHGSTAEAYRVFLVGPLLTLLSFFTLGPLWHHRLKRYQFTNATYGKSRFSFTAPIRDFYAAYVVAGLAMVALTIGTLVIMGVGTGVGRVIFRAPVGSRVNPVVLTILAFMAATSYAVVIVAGQAITRARIQNAVWNNVSLDGHRFVSTIEPARLFGILFTNLFATIFTIGLFRPFAQVRLARYLVSTFVLVPAAEFGDIVAADPGDVGAIGEETAGLFDFDIAF